jgi:hypothetical protein
MNNKIKIITTSVFIFLCAQALSAPVNAGTVLRLEEISIEGKLQKPQATYILQRAQHLNLGTSLELEDEKLTPRILDDAKRDLLRAPD